MIFLGLITGAFGTDGTDDWFRPPPMASSASEIWFDCSILGMIPASSVAGSDFILMSPSFTDLLMFFSMISLNFGKA